MYMYMCMYMYLQYNLKEDYNRTTAPKRAANYFRYIDKSVEELDQEVTYTHTHTHTHTHSMIIIPSLY